MAQRGRKPKPTALKMLEGNPGGRPLNTKEPKPEKKERKGGNAPDAPGAVAGDAEALRVDGLDGREARGARGGGDLALFFFSLSRAHLSQNPLRIHTRTGERRRRTRESQQYSRSLGPKFWKKTRQVPKERVCMWPERTVNSGAVVVRGQVSQSANTIEKEKDAPTEPLRMVMASKMLTWEHGGVAVQFESVLSVLTRYVLPLLRSG